MNIRAKNELLFLCGLSSILLFKTKKKHYSLIPLTVAGLLLLKKEAYQSFRGQSVIVTGGSRGLGLALAYELVKENANVTLLARDPEELKRAQKKLEGLNKGTVHIITCDVTNLEQLKKAIEEAAIKFDGIDLLINNAGSIIVGPWESMVKEDFEAQLNIHLYAAMNSINCVLPYLRKENSGKRIVNICSMGGRIAAPHMIAYDTSKFALSGFSQGLSAELHNEGITVTTVYPGLLRTGSPIQAVFKGDHEKEFAWFQAADVFPGLSTSASVAAKAIVRASRERRWELMPFLPAKIRLSLSAFFPELLALAMVFLNRLLPRGQSSEYKTGAQSRKIFDKSILTSAFVNKAHKAEEDANQEPKTDAKFNMGLLH